MIINFKIAPSSLSDQWVKVLSKKTTGASLMPQHWQTAWWQWQEVYIISAIARGHVFDGVSSCIYRRHQPTHQTHKTDLFVWAQYTNYFMPIVSSALIKCKRMGTLTEFKTTNRVYVHFRIKISPWYITRYFTRDVRVQLKNIYWILKKNLNVI